MFQFVPSNMKEPDPPLVAIMNEDALSIRPDADVTVIGFVKASPLPSLTTYSVVHAVGEEGSVTAVGDPEDLLITSFVVVIVTDEPLVTTMPVGTTVTTRSRILCAVIDCGVWPSWNSDPSKYACDRGVSTILYPHYLNEDFHSSNQANSAEKSDEKMRTD